MAMLMSALIFACSDEPAGEPVGSTCTTNKDCADSVCWSGECATLDKKKGARCQSNGECKSFNCKNGFCLAGKGKPGEACVHDEQCFDGRCGPEGTCIGLGVDGGPAPDAGVADQAAPDMPRPDLRRPDAALPDKTQPDKQAPDQLQPDAPLPDAQVPDQTPPDLMQPDASLCGNGKLDPTEVCDGALLGGKTCKTQGFTAGALDCLNCQLDDRACYLLGPQLNMPTLKGKGATRPAVGSDNKDFLVAWQWSTGSYQEHIAAATVSAAGKVGTRFVVTSTASRELRPAVASDGIRYLVAWGTAVGATLVQGGKVTTPFGIKLGTGGSPAVSFDGNNFLVSYSVSGAHVYARLVSPTGTAQGSHKLSTSPGYHDMVPSAAWTGSHHLVAWGRTTKAWDVGGTLVAATGKPGLSTDIAISTASGIQRNPDVAADGQGAGLVVWEDTRQGGYDILAKPVSASGAVPKTPLIISINTNQKTEPTIAFDGKRYLVAWQEKVGNNNQDIKVARLDSKGKLLGSIFSVAWGGTDQKYPEIAYGGGQFMVVWQNGYYAGALAARSIKFGKGP